MTNPFIALPVMSKIPDVRLEEGVFVKTTTRSCEEAAVFASLRLSQYGGSSSLLFAVMNEAHLVRAQKLEDELAGKQQVWTESLTAVDIGSIDEEPVKLLRPWCDTLWQACGLERSFNFDQEGKWRERRR